MKKSTMLLICILFVIIFSNPLTIQINSGKLIQSQRASSINGESLDTLQIVTLKGGFGVSAVIRNIGKLPLRDIEWSIEFGKGVKIGSFSSGRIPEIEVGDESRIRSGFIFGFGFGNVTVVARDFSIVQNYLILGPIVLLKKGSGNQIKNHDMIVCYIDNLPRTLDPADAYDDSSMDVISQVYDTLVRLKGNETKIFFPSLAIDWTVSNDSLTWTFHLRPNVKFSNGNDFTAEDVKYSFDRVLTMGAPESGVDWILAQCLDTNSTAIINDSTVRITLTHPFGGFLALVAHTVAAIVDKDYVEDHGGVVPGEENTYVKEHPMGTGPFVLDHWTEATEILLMKNQNYWGGWDGEHPEKVLFTDVDEPAKRIFALKNGDADFAYIPYVNLDDVIGEDGIFVHSFDSYDVQLIAMNTKESHNVYLADGVVRKAFSYAFDYDSAIENAWNEYASRLAGAIPTGMPYDDTQNNNQPYFTYNLTMAEQILDDAGYLKDYEFNGELYRFNGTTMRLFYNAGNSEREKMAVMFRGALDEIGILSSIIAEGWPQLLHRMYTTDDWDMMFLGWGPDYNDPDDYIAPLIGSADISQDTYNTGYMNETVDEKIVEAICSVDPAVRNAAYQEAYDIYIQEPPMIFIDQFMFVQPMREWVLNYNYNPVPGYHWNFYDCYKGGLQFNGATRSLLLYGSFQ
jgi:peptide/nickel transport system substrate-binding protein